MNGRVPVSGAQALPAPLTRLFGREADAEEITGLVAQRRLVSLSGPPGCGKTRLALAVGARVAPRFRDGIWFVDLTAVSSVDRIGDAVAHVLGIADQPGSAPVATLTRALRDRELLLVLDGCEHLVEAVGDLTGALIDCCAGVRVLATSRLALGLPGEQVWRVTALDPSPAVELFVDRARLVASDLRIAESERPLVAEICRRLDGLPLAIELAAAWTRVLSLAQLLDRLDETLLLLKDSSRTATLRQETMEATVDSSYRLLTPAEQELFEQLSVFAGGFDLAAVEAVADAGPDVLADLTSLVDHSLVGTDAASPGPMRYRLLEPLRQYGEARLRGGAGMPAAQQRHATYYLELVRHCDAAYRDDQRGDVFRRLEQDEANLIAALEWARTARSDLGLRLACALARFWESQGRVREGRAWLEELLAVADGDPVLRSSALARTARLAWRQRDHAAARAMLEESIAVERELGRELAVARRSRDLALVLMTEGDVDSAVRLGERSVAAFRTAGDERGLVWALIFLGLTRYVGGDLQGGDADIAEALTHNVRLDSVAVSAHANLYLSYTANLRGDVEDERLHVTQALDGLRQMGDLLAVPDWLWAGCALALSEGRPHAALRLAGGAEALGRRGGSYLNEQFMAPLRTRVEEAREEVGRGRAEQLVTEGAEMTLEELLAEAVAQPVAAEEDPLSPREREVAALVGEGLTNTEIAGRLYISKRTVESHVDHIKQKLDLGSRAQVVAWVIREVSS